MGEERYESLLGLCLEPPELILNCLCLNLLTQLESIGQGKHEWLRKVTHAIRKQLARVGRQDTKSLNGCLGRYQVVALLVVQALATTRRVHDNCNVKLIS
jgi:hypothetical protein